MMIRNKLFLVSLFALTLLFVRTVDRVKATISYNGVVEAVTYDYEQPYGWVKSFNYWSPKPIWGSYGWSGLNYASLNSVRWYTAGGLCYNDSAGQYGNDNVTGPGSDVWVYAPGSGWVTTWHQYDHWSGDNDAVNLYTSFIYPSGPLGATRFYWDGGTNPWTYCP